MTVFGFWIYLEKMTVFGLRPKSLRRATLYTIDEAPECSFPTKIAQKIGIFLYFSSLLNGLLEYN
jgi:hypothetical protein